MLLVRRMMLSVTDLMILHDSLLLFGEVVDTKSRIRFRCLIFAAAGIIHRLPQVFFCQLQKDSLRFVQEVATKRQNGKY